MQQRGQRQGQAQGAKRRGQTCHGHQPTQQSGRSQHGGRHGPRPRGPGPSAGPHQALHQPGHRPRGQAPQPGQQHRPQRQRRDHEGDPRNGHQVGHQPHQRDLAKQHQRQRGQRQADAPLRAAQLHQRPPARRRGQPHPGTPGQTRGGEGRWGIAPARAVHAAAVVTGFTGSGGPVVGGQQHAHGHKTQPKTGLQRGPRVPGQHHSHGHGGHPHPRPAPPQQAQAQHHGQHQHRALGRNAPARKQRVGQRQHTPAPGRRHRGGAGQQQAAAPHGAEPGGPAPQARHRPGGQPGPQGDVQARNGHEVGHAGGAEHVPVGPLDGGLVAHGERGQHPGHAAVGHMGVHGVAHALAGHVDAPGGRGQALGRRVFGAGAHVAGGAHALLPQPQLAVKTVGVGQAVGLAQAQCHAPALARAGGGDVGRGVPAQHHARRQVGGLAGGGQGGPRFGAGGEAPALRGGAGQVVHHHGGQQGLALQPGVQPLALALLGAPAGAARRQQGRGAHQAGHQGPPQARVKTQPGPYQIYS